MKIEIDGYWRLYCKIFNQSPNPLCRVCGTKLNNDIQADASGNICRHCYYVSKSKPKARYQKNWRDNYPEKIKILQAKASFNRRRAEGSFTLEEWNNKLKECNYRCVYCGRELASNKITIDHVIPIIRGGSNYIENLVPACRSCNSKKHDKTADEFLVTFIKQ